MISEPFRSTAVETRRRLLDAAARVFAQSGLEGATTREIAREAGVNEVTLFRHFHSKDKLLSAVLQRTFDHQDTGVANVPPISTEAPASLTPVDLRDGLKSHARKYEELLRGNILLLRTLIGEIHRHGEHETRVIKAIFAPVKADMVAMIRDARERGAVRAEVDPAIAADLLAGMIFMEVLRRSLPSASCAPMETYLETALDVFLHGIAHPLEAEPPSLP